jgi:regulator of protease activity HflC (stomatin/prohibitin superfamily)
MKSLTTFLLTLLAVFTLGCTAIDEGERGVLLKHGKVQEVVEPGMVSSWQWGIEVKKISIRRETFETTALAVTSDQQRVDIELAINYQVDPAMVLEVYQTVGESPERWDAEIKPKLLDAAKSVVSHYSVNELNAGRDAVRDAIYAALEGVMPSGFKVNSLQMTGVTFSSIYNAAIELEKNKLDVQRQTQLAEADAKSEIARANGEAEALAIRGTAWAKYLHTLGPDGVALVLQSQEVENRAKEIEKWDGQSPVTVAGQSSIMLPLGK